MSNVLLRTLTAKSCALANEMMSSLSSCFKMETAAFKEKHSIIVPKKKKKNTKTYTWIVANASGLPATIISTRIWLVQLVAVMLVPTHVQNGHAKRSLATVLRIRLFNVTQIRNQLFAWHRFAIVQLESLSDDTQLICQYIGVRSNAGHRANHVTIHLERLSLFAQRKR